MNDEGINYAQNPSDDEVGARELQLVTAGPAQFGIFADEISGIFPWWEPAPLPYAPKSVLGVVSIEGRMLTVLNLASLPASAEKDEVPRPRSGHFVALRGDEQLALAVDTVGEKIELVDSATKSQPATAGTVVIGVLHYKGADVNLLNLKELFAAAIQGNERRRRRF